MQHINSSFLVLYFTLSKLVCFKVGYSYTLEGDIENCSICVILPVFMTCKEFKLKLSSGSKLSNFCTDTKNKNKPDLSDKKAVHRINTTDFLCGDRTQE